jgi:hypothetical protein
MNPTFFIGCTMIDAGRFVTSAQQPHGTGRHEQGKHNDAEHPEKQ